MSNEATDSATTAEFRFLEGDAARVGRTAPLPAVERVWTSVGDGRRVSALRFAPQNPPQLVTLHGVGLNAHSFDPMLLALDVPALSIDLPGHGRSDWREDADYRPDHLAVDVVTTLEALCSQPVTLLGHSLGGLTASLVAAARPELVSQLIVVDITPGISPSRDAGSVTEFITGQRDYGSVEEIVDRAIQFGIGSDRAALTRGVSLNTRQRADGRLEWTHHFAHLEGPLPAGAADDPQPYAPIWASLQSLDVPVTLVQASAGVVSEELAAEWQDQLPDSSIITIDGPHNLHEATPRELADVVRRTLTP
ncbi:alpha/beta hydrolase [Leucobacter viscericola]|uniref:Alpha/beta hydrolase n=1 Tax=Leucobacter viscericola TaxID=2714935 RepID=A0A6G7XCK7_9MICO|nr:alpha/beta hydrolase [Leucobacter viscericola]QIK62295.1 alpha/beta hydrolase [Leucobacter viscericola]